MKHKKIACIYIPHIFEEIEKAIKNDTLPIIVASGTSEKDIIIDFDPELEKYGVSKGNYLKSLGILGKKVDLCPVNHDYMDRVKQNILSFLKAFSPVVEPDSYYRYYIDLTGTYRLFGRSIDTVEQIIRGLKEKFFLTARAGIGQNILIASTASLLAGDMAVYEIVPHSEKLFIGQLSLSIIPLLPNSIKRVLASDYNLTKFKDISKLSKENLISIAKEHGEALYSFSRGISRSFLLTRTYQKGIKVKVMPNPGSDDNAVRNKVSKALLEVSLMLYSQRINPDSIQIAITYQDNYQFRFYIKHGLQYINGKEIYNKILPYLNKALRRRTGMKIIVIKFIDFRQTAQQLPLFPEVLESTRLDNALIHIKKRFGKNYINYGV